MLEIAAQQSPVTRARWWAIAQLAIPKRVALCWGFTTAKRVVSLECNTATRALGLPALTNEMRASGLNPSLETASIIGRFQKLGKNICNIRIFFNGVRIWG
jgi:hypothetical protein